MDDDGRIETVTPVEPPTFKERAAAWTYARRDFALDVLRFYLGAALVVRGLLILAHPDVIEGYMSSARWMWPAVVTHYVVTAHLVGGLCLALGLRTRLAAAIQLPALFGAVFLVHMKGGLLMSGQALELSALVLFLLLMFTVIGAGRYSLDHWLSAPMPPRRTPVPAPA